MASHVFLHSINDPVEQQPPLPASQPYPRAGPRAGHASTLDKTGGLRAVSPNSNNPALVSRIDDHSPRR